MFQKIIPPIFVTLGKKGKARVLYSTWEEALQRSRETGAEGWVSIDEDGIIECSIRLRRSIRCPHTGSAIGAD